MIFVANSNLLELRGFQNVAGSAYINDATVELTNITDLDGNVVAGASSLSMAYVSGSNGNYRVVLSESLPFVAGTRYLATITANGGSGLVGVFRLTFTAQNRGIS